MELKKSYKVKSLLRLLVSVVAVAALYALSSVLHFRIDLTSDKLYTLQPITREILKNLNGEVSMKIYLDGDLPTGFIRMKRMLTETLDEFNVASRGKVRYELVNPYSAKNSREQDRIFAGLYDKGLAPTSVQQRNRQGGSSQTIVFPGLLMSYRGKEMAVNLLKNNPMLSAEENLNLSIQNFEFALVDALVKLSTDSLPRIAFIQGHGELDEFETGDIEKSLSEYFRVDRVILNGDMEALKPYSVAIVAGPTKPFPEEDKLVVDQFIMRGGKVLWFVDPVAVSLDSLSTGASTLAFVAQTNLDDMLFRYGVRLNPFIVQDLQCAVIPVNIAPSGQASKFAPAPWPYFPLLIPPSNHPVTRNLNPILTRFVSPVDTVGENPLVKKHYLLYTSATSRILQVPLLINLSEIEQTPNEQHFINPNVPVAAELEGYFTSVLTNRPLKNYNHGEPFEFRAKSSFTRMVVVADADMVRNDVQHRPNGAYVLPLGYDRYTQQTYGNKELVMNMVKYLNDDNGIVNLRSRDFKLRLLDRSKASQSRLAWQVVNTVLPSLVLVLGGLIYFFIRRNHYSTPK